jgi:hypothetical protein
MNLDHAAAVIVNTLQAAGLRATVDERDINPPCVYVRPPLLHFRFGKGWNAEWVLTAVVADNGGTYALAALGGLVAAVQDAMGWLAVTARPVSLTVPGGAAPFPAYEMTFTQRIGKD